MRTKKGLFINTRPGQCSIYELGVTCYDILKNHDKYTLDYTDTIVDTFPEYDFIIFNYHYVINNWINRDIIEKNNVVAYGMVIECTFGYCPLGRTAQVFDYYMVMDPTVIEKNTIIPFPRPLQKFEVSKYNSRIPIIGSFGFPGPDKRWELIVKLTQEEFDEALIRFHMPYATFDVGFCIQSVINIKRTCESLITKPGIKLEITSDYKSRSELIEWLSQNTINCFLYERNPDMLGSGLSSAIDQAIIAGRPILVSEDPTFRHLHHYIPFYPEVRIKDAIEKTHSGVLHMKNIWTCDEFHKTFNKLYERTIQV